VQGRRVCQLLRPRGRAARGARDEQRGGGGEAAARGGAGAEGRGAALGAPRLRPLEAVRCPVLAGAGVGAGADVVS